MCFDDLCSTDLCLRLTTSICFAYYFQRHPLSTGRLCRRCWRVLGAFASLWVLLRSYCFFVCTMCGMRYLLVYLHSRVCWTNVPPGRNFVQVYYVRNGQIARSEPCYTVEPANTGGVGSACFTDLDSPQHETLSIFLFSSRRGEPVRALLVSFVRFAFYLFFAAGDAFPLCYRQPHEC